MVLGVSAGHSLSTPPAAEAVVWHDVECAAYGADLPVWRELAGERGGPVLEIGSGTGRVALDLALRGHEVLALDSEPALVRALAARARDWGLQVRAHVADARSFELERQLALVIAPMQVSQLMGGAAGRSAMLASVCRHLMPGGLFAAALADPFEAVPADSSLPPPPDVREEDGWVFASTPVAVRPLEGAVAIDRLRQAVSPKGELSESYHSVTLDTLSAAELQSAAAGLGFRVLPRRRVPGTSAYVGSTICLLERA